MRIKMQRQLQKHAVSARDLSLFFNLHVPPDVFTTVHGDELILAASERVHDVKSHIVSDDRGRGFLPRRKFAFAAHTLL
jgi:hypothetical protein